MLSKCANPACSAPFRRLREGKLFVVETEYPAANAVEESRNRRERLLRRVEHFWLCDQCAAFITLTFDRDRGMITVPLPDGRGKKTVTLRDLAPARKEPSAPGAALSFPVSQARGI